ncbi:hypothetical protein ACIF8T_37030 [Streptomyces sp. NPDC085946]|uniref:hypothetical protein n=1 Tax=Streptomyces sp. NPDC085946 TaxID=3365744 RepID=UPI0037CF4F3E
MHQRSHGHTPPSWTKPGARWWSWIYWPMLCVTVGLLAWRVIEGADGASIALSACHVLLWGALLVANRSARRRHR